MATTKYRDTRIAALKKERQKAVDRKAKAEQTIVDSEASIVQLDKTLDWLQNMPVSDKAQEKPKDDA
jgi:hypothetical protein